MVAIAIMVVKTTFMANANGLQLSWPNITILLYLENLYDAVVISSVFQSRFNALEFSKFALS